ncbi:MAG: DUF927 domain-containing protein [Anaerolineae bacterium]|nr:DUF927 domain-containing protein [Anaerolineae bacterium]
MEIIEAIKERLTVDAVIGRYVRLTKVGKSVRGLCPFHPEQNPSFYVFLDTQRWRCFGCGAGGDILDFVMRREGWDLQTAIRELAAEAQIEWRAQSTDELRTLALMREVETVFSEAASFFHEELGLAGEGQAETGSPGLAYARRRGFTDETLRAAGVGFFGMAWDDLRHALQVSRIALDCPAAVALLGFRGDVRAWCETHGIEPTARWVEEGRIRAMPPNLLIYPHIVNGRAIYLSGRYIEPSGEGPKGWNPPAALVGAREPYVNWLWGQKQIATADAATAPISVIVEGQADALSLGQWGIPALALAGCDVGEHPSVQHPAVLQVRRQLTLTDGAVAIGLDQDAAGTRATPKLVAALQDVLGLKATTIHHVNWPVADANAWLQNGATAHEAQALLREAPTWIEVLLERARPSAAQEEGNREAVQMLFASLIGLDAYELGRMRERVSRELRITRGTFDTMLRAVRQEAVLNGEAKAKYSVVDGRLCHQYVDPLGTESSVPLANFSARIATEIVEDDGESQTRVFRIVGRLADGRDLPPAHVDAGDFSGMGWVLEQWGAQAVVEAGASKRDHLRAAIQAVSSDMQLQHVYGHLGWRELDGKSAYLSGNGAVGHDGVDVRLPHDLLRYQLPRQPQHVAAAAQASLRFLDVGDCAVTMPLLAAVYLAPVSCIVPPSFTLWVHGTTGSLKSSLTALAMSHYGMFSYNTPPASWTNTANALEKKSFVVKDSMLWIDDYTTQGTATGMNELRVKADQLLRDWGNRSGRARMQADLRLRQTFAPRGLIVSTAEQLPSGQSIQARLFQVEVHPEMITRGAGSLMTQAQVNDAQLYPHAMAGYVLWLAERWEELNTVLPERLMSYTELARTRGAHLRMPGNVAALFLGWELFLQYSQHLGVVAEYEALREFGWSVLSALGDAQQSVVQDENPVAMYIRALQQLLAQGAIFTRNREHPDLVDFNNPPPEKCAVGAEFVGWYDRDYLYLLPGVAFRIVNQFYRGSGIAFPDTEHGLKTKLREQNLSFPTESDRRGGHLYQLPLANRPWVLRITNFLDLDTTI